MWHAGLKHSVNMCWLLAQQISPNFAWMSLFGKVLSQEEYDAGGQRHASQQPGLGDCIPPASAPVRAGDSVVHPERARSRQSSSDCLRHLRMTPKSPKRKPANGLSETARDLA